jgi:hypothetical protein
MRRSPQRRERVGKGAAHNHVARLIDRAEQAGIALDGALGIDNRSWCKNGSDGRLGRRCKNGVPQIKSRPLSETPNID